MRSLLAVSVALALCVPVLAGCDDGGDPAPGTAGNGGSAGGAPLAPCLERPTDLPRPPTRGLPCELLPPNFSR